MNNKVNNSYPHKAIIDSLAKPKNENEFLQRSLLPYFSVFFWELALQPLKKNEALGYDFP